MSNVIPFQKVAEDIQELREWVENEASSCNCNSCYGDALEHVEVKLARIRAYAAENDVVMVITADDLMTSFGEEGSSYYEESSSYYNYEEEDSYYNEDEDGDCGDPNCTVCNPETEGDDE